VPGGRTLLHRRHRRRHQERSPRLPQRPPHRARPPGARPPTTFQISNVRAGTGATNVIPGELDCLFNFRFSTESTAEGLAARTEAVLERHGLDYQVEWSLSGQPFLTPAGELVEAARQAVRTVSGFTPALSTSGGTSDGRFIAPTGAQVIELGPVNASIHQVDEWVDIDGLERLSRIYEAILTRLLGDP